MAIFNEVNSEEIKKQLQQALDELKSVIASGGSYEELRNIAYKAHNAMNVLYALNQSGEIDDNDYSQWLQKYQKSLKDLQSDPGFQQASKNRQNNNSQQQNAVQGQNRLQSFLTFEKYLDDAITELKNMLMGHMTPRGEGRRQAVQTAKNVMGNAWNKAKSYINQGAQRMGYSGFPEHHMPLSVYRAIDEGINETLDDAWNNMKNMWNNAGEEYALRQPGATQDPSWVNGDKSNTPGVDMPGINAAFLTFRHKIMNSLQQALGLTDAELAGVRDMQGAAQQNQSGQQQQQQQQQQPTQQQQQPTPGQAPNRTGISGSGRSIALDHVSADAIMEALENI